MSLSLCDELKGTVFEAVLSIAMEITDGVNNITINASDSHKKNRIQVSNTKKPLLFYVNLAKRYMQQYNEVELSALGMAISRTTQMADTLDNLAFWLPTQILNDEDPPIMELNSNTMKSGGKKYVRQNVSKTYEVKSNCTKWHNEKKRGWNLELRKELGYHSGIRIPKGPNSKRREVTMKNPHILLLSVSLPTPPPETVFLGGLPSGAIEAIKAAYGAVVQILDPPRDGFNLTLKLNLNKLPPDEEYRHALLLKIASVREVVLGAPLRGVLKKLGARNVASNTDGLVALLHRPNESFFLIPQVDKVTVVFPMRFKDSIDIVLATSFLQEFVEARRAAGLNSAPPCLWSPTPPLELKEAPTEALSANAGFVTFVIFPRHVEGKKLDRTVWSLSTFHAYVSYHVKALDRAKPGMEDGKNAAQSRSFKRLSLKEARTNSS
ncbi:hypothetical protein C1H46_004414 [Malus baccata]|uniref:DNA/RNA-binding protein Alba-like domain-containing protein n=1 Tax=Malus baccata TaxID=106549 RepID=A0A540NG30_MALBA|nr:hypothetical protein C1H46_004414 [Malus baccata]